MRVQILILSITISFLNLKGVCQTMGAPERKSSILWQKAEEVDDRIIFLSGGWPEQVYPDSLIFWGEKARLQAERSHPIQYEEEKGAAILLIAAGHLKKGDLSRALHMLKQTLEIFKTTGYLKGQGDALHLIGLTLDRKGDLQQSAYYFYHSQEIYKQYGYQAELAYTLNKLGELYAKMENHPEALKHYQEGLKIAENIADTGQVALLNTNIGRSFSALGLYPQAKDHLHRSLRLHSTTGERDHLVSALNHLGSVFFQQGELDSARSFLEMAYENARQTNRTRHLPAITEKLFSLYEKQKDHQKALHFHKEFNTSKASLEKADNQERIDQLNMDHAFRMELAENDDLLQRGQLLQKVSLASLAAALIFILFLGHYYREKKSGMLALQLKNQEILKTRDQLVIQEKLATLGQLAAGIAHEIKNPLNFVNNFAESSIELSDELVEELEKLNIAVRNGELKDVQELIRDIRQNAIDINRNGIRADRIVNSIMEHARGNNGEAQQVDLNALIDENVHLAFHGYRALDPSFNLRIETNYDDSLETIRVIPQDLGRVFLNIINNACFALSQKQKAVAGHYQPTLTVRTGAGEDNMLEISIRDNGTGIPNGIRQKIFSPFFTTKPSGLGNTGLGLSISYDIIVIEHKGTIEVESEPGEFTRFLIRLPLKERQAAL